jgi:hypothetical protein
VVLRIEESAQTLNMPLVQFAPSLLLAKEEVFEACEELARVEQLLLSFGYSEEARWAAKFLEELEHRLSPSRPA